MVTNIKTPGVYISEQNAFLNTVVPIATAVPAFFGYTPQTKYQGKSLINKAVKVSSFTEFESLFISNSTEGCNKDIQPYSPDYYLCKLDGTQTSYSTIDIDGDIYAILPDPSSIYYLYNSVRLFFINGGGDVYIVSTGSYGPRSKKHIEPENQYLINPNVKLDELIAGLKALEKEQEPTLYICPDATLLTRVDNSSLMQEMLTLANEKQTAMCLFDVIGADQPDPLTDQNDIEAFRNSLSHEGLNYAAAYYPFIVTNVMAEGELDYSNLFGGNTTQLKEIINPKEGQDCRLDKILSQMEAPNEHSNSRLQNHLTLAASSQSYKKVINSVSRIANTLPPSGAMAGVYVINDAQNGVWNSPANMPVIGAVSPPIKITDVQQESINIDAVSGKSINAIRIFRGHGILVWGARTLDGNSSDWRYIAVLRTVTYIEQTIKLAARSYVFEPNEQQTWSAIKAMISNFLTDVWKQGGLQGAFAADAFQVDVGLGTTMTPEDILNSLMRVQIKIAVVHPAEFILITFEQEMAKEG